MLLDGGGRTLAVNDVFDLVVQGIAAVAEVFELGVAIRAAAEFLLVAGTRLVQNLPPSVFQLADGLLNLGTLPPQPGGLLPQSLALFHPLFLLGQFRAEDVQLFDRVLRGDADLRLLDQHSDPLGNRVQLALALIDLLAGAAEPFHEAFDRVEATVDLLHLLRREIGRQACVFQSPFPATSGVGHFLAHPGHFAEERFVLLPGGAKASFDGQERFEPGQFAFRLFQSNREIAGAGGKLCREGVGFLAGLLHLRLEHPKLLAAIVGMPRLGTIHEELDTDRSNRSDQAEHRQADAEIGGSQPEDQAEPGEQQPEDKDAAQSNENPRRQELGFEALAGLAFQVGTALGHPVEPFVHFDAAAQPRDEVAGFFYGGGGTGLLPIAQTGGDLSLERLGGLFRRRGAFFGVDQLPAGFTQTPGR